METIPTHTITTRGSISQLLDLTKSTLSLIVIKYMMEGVQVPIESSSTHKEHTLVQSHIQEHLVMILLLVKDRILEQYRKKENQDYL